MPSSSKCSQPETSSKEKSQETPLASKEKLGLKRRQSLFLFTLLVLVSYIVLGAIYVGDPTLHGNNNAIDFISPSTLFKVQGNSGNIREIELNDAVSYPPPPPIACRIPNLDPFHSSIKHLIFSPEKINCEHKFPLLFESTLNSTLVPVQSVHEMKTKFGIEYCCYQTIRRTELDNLERPDDSYLFSDSCHPISLANITVIPPRHEFLVIHCLQQNVSSNSAATEQWSSSAENFSSYETMKRGPIWRIMDMHAFVHEKHKVEKRIKKQRAKSSNKKHISDEVNVVILGLDAVSHMNFIRTMPLSHNFLVNNLSAVEMNRFNKIGDNTFPNIGAVLTSLNVSEMSSTCEKNETFDECPFIWKEYASQGFRTSYGEDSTWMGIFNYLKVGFRKPPTDYYLRPFGVAAEEHIASYKKLNSKMCYGPRLSFQVLLDYMKKFAFRMGSGGGKRYFQLIWSTSLTHDFLNDGQLGDEHLLSTLKWFQEEEFLNQTVLIVMSDHGIRWGEILDYPQGQLEERLPFLYFVLPNWFTQKYASAYENLLGNKNRLTTPYDLHETLVDLLYLDNIQDKNVAKRELSLEKRKDGLLPRGISHFLPIPEWRTCEMAGIEEHYCTCNTFKVAPVTQAGVEQAANYAVHFINLLISKRAQCGFLSLAGVKSAQTLDFEGRREKAYQLSFTTSPGGASFQASVIRSAKGLWRVSGTISRTNLYGNQSECIDEKELKMYCFCVHLDK